MEGPQEQAKRAAWCVSRLNCTCSQSPCRITHPFTTGSLAPIRFKTALRNVILDVFRSRGWKVSRLHTTTRHTHLHLKYLLAGDGQ